MSDAGSRVGSANQRATPSADSSVTPCSAWDRALITAAIGLHPRQPDYQLRPDALRHQAAPPCARRRRARGCASRRARRGGSRRSDSRCRRRARPSSPPARRSGGSSPGAATGRGLAGATPDGRRAARQAPVAEALLVADRGRCDLAALPDDEDDLGVELRHTEHALRPSVVVALLVTPLVDERLVERVLQLPGVAVRVEWTKLEPVGPGRRRNPGLEVTIMRW